MLEGSELRAAAEITEALASSLDLREVMRATQPLLMKLVGAEHAALGVVHPEDQGTFDWITTNLPPEFFAGYAELAAHDFVLKAVARAPHVVLRDSEMVSRQQLEANPLHRRAQELGVPLEHVMGVMLEVGPAGSSGVAVYRGRKRPFSTRELLTLQALTPALVNAVRNCRLFQQATERGRILEEVIATRHQSVIAFDRASREVVRTDSATKLLDKWFPSASPKAPGVLPDALLEQVRCWLALADGTVPVSFRMSSTCRELVVQPLWHREANRALLVLVFREGPKAPWSSAVWARLTRREREVVAGLVRGWDNELLAQELGCEKNTIKKHLSRIFDKLGVASRAQLIASARQQWP